jgi:hypothetical protein
MKSRHLPKRHLRIRRRRPERSDGRTGALALLTSVAKFVDDVGPSFVRYVISVIEDDTERCKGRKRA